MNICNKRLGISSMAALAMNLLCSLAMIIRAGKSITMRKPTIPAKIAGREEVANGIDVVCRFTGQGDENGYAGEQHQAGSHRCAEDAQLLGKGFQR